MIYTNSASPGFGPLELGDITIEGKPIQSVFHQAVTDVTIQRGIHIASNVTVQMTDPKREILNDPDFLQQGYMLEIPDGFGNKLQFIFVHVTKASDQLQLMFESRAVYNLRNARSILQNSSDITDAASFVQYICSQHGVAFVGPAGDPTTNPKAFAMSGGSTYVQNEDAWATFQRMAGTLGWRCWESAGTLFFGPDEYWLNGNWNGGHPPVNSYYNHDVPTLKEFHENIQLIDYTWDVGMQFGDLNITCMVHDWKYNPGEIINIDRMGPGNGKWIVTGMQRNFFNPQATVSAAIPMPAALVLTPPTEPIIGGRVPI